MSAASELGLNEALVSVAQPEEAASTLLDFYYQNAECFGCPLDRLPARSIETNGTQNFVLGTTFQLQVLELIRGNKTLCKLEDVQLNSHAHYRIDVTANSTGLCLLETLDEGERLAWPFVLLACLLLVSISLERIYKRACGRTIEASATFRYQEKVSEQPSGDESPDHARSGRSSFGEIDETTTGQVPRNHASLAQSGSDRLQANRVQALDAFRGLTIAGMIMVNYGGAGYAQLQHKPWDGLALADLVFPFFIFSMGASIAISGRSMLKRRCSAQRILLRILQRSFLLVAIGLSLNSKWLGPEANLRQLRLTGVLQRFGISYLVVATMYSVELCTTSWLRAQSLYRVPFLVPLVSFLFEAATALEYLAAYIYVTFFFSYSGSCPPGYTGPGGATDAGRWANCTGGAAAWLDRRLLGERHLYHNKNLELVFKAKQSHDPEGLLGYSTSILLTLVGLQCGKVLVGAKAAPNHRARLQTLAVWFVLVLAANGCMLVIPINKHLWSLSFVTASALCAIATLAALYLLMDVYDCGRPLLLRMLVSAGQNSILLYVGHSLLSHMLPWHFAVDETSHWQLLLRLAWSVLVWLLVAHYLAAKKLFVRV